MNKKVLVLSASPREGGNSDLLCDQFIAGAKEGGNEAEKIFLEDKKINYCLGCDECKRNDGICVHQDDMTMILDKMIDADVLVMATPVYFYNMNAQMKTLIDRVYARFREVKNKDIYFIVTAMDERKQAMEKTIEGFRGFTDCLQSIKEKGIIYGTGAWQKGEIKDLPAIKESFEMGRNL